MALDLTGITAVVENLIPWDTVRISRPGSGQRVFDPATGQYAYPAEDVVYEGDGAVVPSGTPGGVTSWPVAGMPWPDETRSRYRALTPLVAPAAERDMIVTVVAVHQGGDLELVGRQFRVQDPSVAATLGVLRITGLDQIQQTREVP